MKATLNYLFVMGLVFISACENVSKKELDTGIITDYLTITTGVAYWNEMHSNPEIRKNSVTLFEKYEMKDATPRKTIFTRGNGYYYDRDNKAIHFYEDWCDPLLQFSTKSGNFPSILVRKGKISIGDDSTSFQPYISEGTEVSLQGKVFSRTQNMWKPLDSENFFSEEDISRFEKIRFVKSRVLTSGDANAKDVSGRSILMRASGICSMSTVKYLVDKGAEINFIFQKNSYNNAGGMGVSVMEISETPLIAALNNECWDVAYFLIEKGANINFHGKTMGNIGLVVMKVEIKPLCFAAINGQHELVELMLSKNADINTIDSMGRTALICASGIGNIKIVKSLISKGADVNIIADGKSALSYAQEQGHSEIAEILRIASVKE